jgi:hypothetical protein
MTRHELPDGGWADIRARSTVTAREARTLNRLYVPMLAATKPVRDAINTSLEAAGFDPERLMGTYSEEDQKKIRAIRNDANLDAYATLSDKQLDQLEAYQPVLVATMVREWSYGVPITADEALELEEATYAALCLVANEEWENVVDTSVDGATDPKAATTSSSG